MGALRYGISLPVFNSIVQSKRREQAGYRVNTRREILYLQADMHYLFIIHKGARVEELECGQGVGTRQGG